MSFTCVYPNIFSSQFLMYLLTYSHHFKECFHYPKELILISSNLILFHVNRKLATATENILQVSLPTVAELNPLSSALIIISQFAALVSEEVMWLPRDARVGVSPALSRATKSKKENTGAPSPPSPTIAHHRTEENHELRNVSLGQRKQEIPAPKEKSNTQAGIRRKASVCGLQKALRPVETKSKASAAHSYALEEGAEGGTASHDES